MSASASVESSLNVSYRPNAFQPPKPSKAFVRVNVSYVEEVATRSIASTSPPQLIPSEKIQRGSKSNSRSKFLTKFSTIDSLPNMTSPSTTDLDNWLSSSEAALIFESMYSKYPNSAWEKTLFNQDIDQNRNGSGKKSYKGERKLTSESQNEERLGSGGLLPGTSLSSSFTGDDDVRLSILTSSTKRKCRLDLASRISLKQKTLNSKKTAGRIHAKETNCDENLEIEFGLDTTKVNKLLHKYSDISASVANGAVLPLLSTEEEARIGKMMKSFKSIEDVRVSLISLLGRSPRPDELAEACDLTCQSLETRLEIFRAARNKLIVHNLGMFFRVLHQQHSSKPSRMNIVELRSYALEGIMNAALLYDPSKVSRFACFAAKCMERKIKSAISEFGYIERLPRWVTESAWSISRLKGELANSLGRTPTLQELSKHSGVSTKRLQIILRPFLNTLSLNERDGFTGEEVVNNFSVPYSDSMDEANHTLIRNDIFKTLESLKPNERRVVLERYGFGGRATTLSDVGMRLNMSKQGVQYLEKNALKKLRETSLGKHVTSLENCILA